jgi:hypothetical protein
METGGKRAEPSPDMSCRTRRAHVDVDPRTAYEPVYMPDFLTCA